MQLTHGNVMIITYARVSIIQYYARLGKSIACRTALIQQTYSAIIPFNSRRGDKNGIQRYSTMLNILTTVLIFREREKERERERAEKESRRASEQHMLNVIRNTSMQNFLCSTQYDSEYKIHHSFVPASSTFPHPLHVVHLRIKIYILGIYRYSLRRIKARYFPLVRSSYSWKYSIKCLQRKKKINIMTRTVRYS